MQHLKNYPIQSLKAVFDKELKVTSASNNPLNITGYIEINIKLPGTSKSLSSLITVVADSILSTDMPVLLGSNVLESWKRAMFLNDIGSSESSCNVESSSNVIVIPNLAVVPHNSINNYPIASSNRVPPSSTKADHTPHHTQHDPLDRSKFLKLFNLEKCPPEYREELEAVLVENRTAFAATTQELGKCNITKHNIELSDYTPIKQKYRRIPPNMFNAVKDELDKLYKQGVIRPSTSPWSSPVSIAVKADGSPRLCLDMRKVNDRTKRDAKSIPNVQEMFDRLSGKTIFSSLDLYSGFLQIELEEHCKEISAFTCGPLGFWEMNRMPFGACNSSATFQRTMEIALAELLHQIALVYIDDIIVHSTSPQEHIQSLDKIFKRLSKYGLRLKPKKCMFFSNEIKFLGHMVTDKGLQKDPSKIQAILDWQPPSSVSQVRQFMGLCGFVRKFIPNFATIAAPITDLTRGYSNSKTNKIHNRIREVEKFSWTEAQDQAFKALKHIIAQDVTLSYADFSRPFRLSTDACRTGLGAILEQQEADGKWRPIGFASRRTNDTERNYATHKLEFLALRWAISEKFSDYLRTHRFTVYTDNNPLTYVLTNQKLDATAQRWVASLEPYSFNIEYKPGTDNRAADALSRKYEMEDADSTVRYQAWAKTICDGFDEVKDQYTAAITIHDTLGDVSVTNFDWIDIQDSHHTTSFVKNMLKDDQRPEDMDIVNLHKDTKVLLKYFDDLILKDDLLYYRKDDDSSPRLVIPASKQDELISLYHSLGHIGTKKVLPLLQQRFFWNKMKANVAEFVSKCDRCQKAKTPKYKNRGPLEHILSPSIPMHQLSMDFLMIDTRATSKVKILTVIDEFTKFAWGIIVKSENAKLTAEKLYRELYTKFGIPTVVHTDRGKTFLSNVIKQLNNMLSIKHTTTTPYRPQSNATCERLNETIISRIRSLPAKQKKNWNLHLDSLMLAYNSTVHESIGMSPYFAMFGRHPQIPQDLLVNIPHHDKHKSIQSYTEQRRDDLKEAFEACAENIRNRQKRSKRNFDDRKVAKPIVDFNVSDKVLLIKHVAKNKIDDNYLDEVYEIIERKGNSSIYIVQGLVSHIVKSVHRDNMVLFKQNNAKESMIDPDALPTWHEMTASSRQVTTEESPPVSESMNKKIAVFYGSFTNAKVQVITVPVIISDKNISALLKSCNKDEYVLLRLDSKSLNKVKLKSILNILRQKIKCFKKVIINTHEPAIFNWVLELLPIYFPKPSSTVRKITSNSSSESESSIYENIQTHIVSGDSASNYGSDTTYLSSHEQSVSEDVASDQSQDSSSNSSEDVPDTSDESSGQSPDEDCHRQYNLRTVRRRPIRYKDYV